MNDETTPIPSLLDGQESDFERRMYNARHGLADEASGGNLADRDEDGELVHAGGASWDDLPPVEALVRVEGPPPIDPLQSAAPGVYREYEIRAQFPTPQAMCEAWARVRGFEAESGAVRPRGIVSQLRELREMARLHDPDFDRTVRPSPAQQCADEVERTLGFHAAEWALWERYVRGWPSLGGAGEAALVEFHASLREQWPNGFTGESDAPPPLRSEEIAIIQAEVEEAQRHPRRRTV